MSYPEAWLVAMETPLDAIAAGQHGLVTRSQVLAHMTRNALETWLEKGHLLSVQPGVYRCHGVPASWEQRLLAACLATDGVASHRAAARVWGLPVPALRIEVTVPLGRVVRLQGVRAHRSTLFRPEFLTADRGIPVTTTARTLIDLSAVATDATVSEAVDYALGHELVTLAELTRCFEAMAGRGRRRVAHFREVLNARQPDSDPGESELEARVARWLRAAGLPPPVGQHPVLVGDRRYRIDYAYPDLRIAIELDGWGTHGTRRAFDLDRARGNDLELLGWTLLRFTSTSTRHDVIRTVKAARAAASRRTHDILVPS